MRRHWPGRRVAYNHGGKRCRPRRRCGCRSRPAIEAKRAYGRKGARRYRGRSCRHGVVHDRRVSRGGGEIGLDTSRSGRRRLDLVADGDARRREAPPARRHRINGDDVHGLLVDPGDSSNRDFEYLGVVRQGPNGNAGEFDGAEDHGCRRRCWDRRGRRETRRDARRRRRPKRRPWRWRRNRKVRGWERRRASCRHM